MPMLRMVPNNQKPRTEISYDILMFYLGGLPKLKFNEKSPSTDQWLPYLAQHNQHL